MRLYRIACWLVITIFCSPHQALSEDKLYVGYGYYQSPPHLCPRIISEPPSCYYSHIVCGPTVIGGCGVCGIGCIG